MKILEKVQIVTKLKERIEEMKSVDIEAARQLQKLLDKVIATPNNCAI